MSAGEWGEGGGDEILAEQLFAHSLTHTHTRSGAQTTADGY